MGVGSDTAWQYEGDIPYPFPESFAPPLVVDLGLRRHFIKARTEAWNTRLEKYWDLQRRRKVDEETYGDYRWVQFGDLYRAAPPGFDMDRGQEKQEEFYPGMLSRILISDPHGEAAKLFAYKLRSTVAMHRQSRVGTEFHGFLQLPSEIRNIVYGFLLPKGTYVMLNDGNRVGFDWQDVGGDTYDRYRGLEKVLRVLLFRRTRKTLGLLQAVSRVVHTEATGLFFGGNRFIFPYGDCSCPSFFNSLVDIASDDVQLMDRRFRSRSERGMNNATLVRDVSYTFDMRDLVVSDYQNLCYNDTLKDDIDQAKISSREALLRLHDLKTYKLGVIWAERVDCIKWMTLDRLQLSFDECYCGVGCCRKVEWVLDLFLNTGPLPGTGDDDEEAYSMLDWKARPPLVIECVGWKTAREAELIREKLGRLAETFGSVKIQLGLDVGTEEPRLDGGDQFAPEMLTGSETSGD